MHKNNKYDKKYDKFYRNFRNDIIRLTDKVYAMEEGIRILRQIEKRNNCDSHTMDQIITFLADYKRISQERIDKLPERLTSYVRSRRQELHNHPRIYLNRLSIHKRNKILQIVNEPRSKTPTNPPDDNTSTKLSKLDT